MRMGRVRKQSPFWPLGSPECPQGAQSPAAALPHAPVQLLLPVPPRRSTHRHPPASCQGQPRAVLPSTLPAPLPTRSTHPSPPLFPLGLSPWQVQHDHAAFHPQHVGQGCTNGAQGVILRAETSGDLREKPMPTPHGWEQQQQQENTPELLHLQGNPRQHFTCGMCHPKRGAGPDTAGNRPSGRNRLVSSAEHKAKPM